MSVFKLIGKNPSGEPHVRRVRFDATPTNAELRSMAAAYFGIMDPDVDVRLTWTDGDGEAVTIASDGDIAAAVAASVKGTVRVEVGTDVKGKKAVLILHAGTDKEETCTEILTESPSADELFAAVMKHFKTTPADTFVLQYVDSDGDSINICNDEDVTECVRDHNDRTKPVTILVDRRTTESATFFVPIGADKTEDSKPMAVSAAAPKRKQYFPRPSRHAHAKVGNAKFEKKNLKGSGKLQPQPYDRQYPLTEVLEGRNMYLRPLMLAIRGALFGLDQKSFGPSDDVVINITMDAGSAHKEVTFSMAYSIYRLFIFKEVECRAAKADAPTVKRTKRAYEKRPVFSVEDKRLDYIRRQREATGIVDQQRDTGVDGAPPPPPFPAQKSLREQVQAMTWEAQHVFLGEQLYHQIEQLYPEQAPKITGMLLEFDPMAIVALLQGSRNGQAGDDLKNKINEAKKVLEKHEAKLNEEKAKAAAE